MAFRDRSIPAKGSDWEAYGADLHAAVMRGELDSFHLDEFSGTDDQKFNAAMTAQQAASSRNYPPIVLPSRTISLTTPKQMYPGMKVVAATDNSGQKNPEINSGNYIGAKIVLSGSIGTGTNSLFHNANGSTLYDVYMSGFSVQGSQGSAIHQFMDVATGQLYACAFNSLSFNFMKSVFGDWNDNSSARKCLITQVSFTGNWTINNCWKTPFFLGGSDINIMPAMMNIGVSGSAAQTGVLNRYFMVLDTIEATVAGKVYISTMNGWRGLLVSGNSAVDWYGGIIEGYKPTGTNLSGPGPGSQVKVTGGHVSFFGTKIGQGMANPDGSEGGLVDISGGDVSFIGCQFYGANCGTVNSIRHTGGRLSVYTAKRRTDSGTSNSWTGRPRYTSTGSSVPSDADGFYNSTFTLTKDYSIQPL